MVRLVITEENYIVEYKTLQIYRDRIANLIQTFLWFEELPKELAVFLENVKNSRIENEINNELKDTLLHEIFITIIGIYLKAENYDSISYLTNKTFFTSIRKEEPTSFNLFYTSNQPLDAIVSKRDSKKYHSGTAQLWMETINPDVLTRNELVTADNLLYNIAVFGKNYLYHWWWFPITYVYDNGGKQIADIFKKMVSREYLSKLSTIFGYEKPNDFIDAIKTKVEDISDKRNRYRYPAAWDDAPLLIDFVEVDKIGKYN